MSTLSGSHDAEVAFLVRDCYCRRGLGAELLLGLVRLARGERLERLPALMLLERTPMQSLARKAGFRIAEKEDPALLCRSFDISATLGR